MKRMLSMSRLQPAFTLIETLLALGLSSVLLLVVFNLIDSTVTYHVTGNDQVLVSQRLIGLLQDLRMDIRSVEADPHWNAVPLQTETLDPRLEAASRMVSQLQLTDLEKFAEPIRLAGQKDWLMLTLPHANPRWPGDAQRFQQVVWSLSGHGSVTVTTHDDHGRWTTQSIPDLGKPGLIRSRLMEKSQRQVIRPDLVVPAEVLNFRYLSDGRWQTNWNSSSEKRLPDAIEVSLQISGDAEQRTWIIQTSPWRGPARTTK